MILVITLYLLSRGTFKVMSNVSDEAFCENVKSFQSLTILGTSSIIDILKASEYASAGILFLNSQ